MTTPYDVIIIGSGVPCTQELVRKGVRCLLLDKGKFERDRNKPHDITNGFYGASIFSDGKFSLFPAGQAVWNLQNQEQIREGLRATIRTLSTAGV
jgi:hypothetical protein